MLRSGGGAVQSGSTVTQHAAQGGWSGEERRADPRVEVSIAARIRIGGTVYLGLIRDLSAAGAYIELLDADPFPEEGAVLLTAGAFGPEPLAALLRSKRIDEGLVRGIGVEFTLVPAGARAALERILGERRG